MLEQVRKIGTIVVIAILFSFFSFSLVDVAMEKPRYDDFCLKPVPAPLNKDCKPLDIGYCRGQVTYIYGDDGCPVDYKCDNCNEDYQDAMKKYRFYGFLITGILGVLAILAGLYVRGEDAMEWVLSGLLIGGVISVFIGTIMYYNDMHRFLRPVVLLAEMLLIILIVLRTFRKHQTKSI